MVKPLAAFCLHSTKGLLRQTGKPLSTFNEGQAMYAVDIKWDTDDEDVDLPNVVKVPDNLTDGEDISDWLSDEYGFCHDGFVLKEV